MPLFGLKKMKNIPRTKEIKDMDPASSMPTVRKKGNAYTRVRKQCDDYTHGKHGIIVTNVKMDMLIYTPHISQHT